jgi:hypothetical protein
MMGNFWPSKPRVSCQYLHFAQTEDIQFKSALEGKMDALLIEERTECNLTLSDFHGSSQRSLGV